MNDGNTDWDDDSDAIANLDGGLHRRRLLGAAGGFALAASGLLLPEWLEEAEAREGALGGAMGGRHGNDRRGRDRRKRRTHGDKKNTDKVPDRPLQFRHTAVTIRNYLGQPVHCILFAAPNKGGDTYGPFVEINDVIVGNGKNANEYRFDPRKYRLGILIRELNYGKDVFCDVRNMRIQFPRGGASTGDNLDPANGNVGTVYIREQGFFVHEEAFNQRAVLRRLKDDWHGERRIEWRFTVR